MHFSLSSHAQCSDDLSLLCARFLYSQGSTANSLDPALLVRRIMAELQRAFRLEGDLPSEPRLAFELFPLWLERACKRSPVVLLIDGIDQLSDVDGEASSLRWLPSTIPLNCSMVLTMTTGSAAVKAASKWQDGFVHLENLTQEDKEAATHCECHHPLPTVNLRVSLLFVVTVAPATMCVPLRSLP
jgi:hypothetical protein